MINKPGVGILQKVEDLISSPTRASDGSPKKILLVAPEVSPYANVGGVSRVVAFLASSLVRAGHDARVFMPKFGSIDEAEYELETVYRGLRVPTETENKPSLSCNVKRHQIPGLAPVYFLENREYYELRANVYGYKDDPIRWALLSRGVLEYLRCCSDWIPDVIHANDWQLGVIPNYMKTVYKEDSIIEKISSVFTIHNLQFQGMFDHTLVSDLDYDDGKSPIVDLFSERLEKLNFMRRGIMYADTVNAVSPTYAREILRPEYGQKLERLLTEVRSKLSGILNGIDYEEFNPSTDKLIPTNYDLYSIEKREQNKEALQAEFDLRIDNNIPIIGFVGRLDPGQKGLDLLMQVLDPLMKDFKVQFVFIGGGDGDIVGRIMRFKEKYPDMIGAHLMPDFNLPRLLFAGSDIVIVPSRFEPCGLVQMEAMRYGAIPLVHATGGLNDSVVNYDLDNEEGFGFKFSNYDPWSLFAQIVRALETYRQKDVWRRIQKRAMQQDNSWDARSAEYVSLYEKAIQLHARSLKDAGKIEQGKNIYE